MTDIGSAFEAASGSSPEHVSLLVRSILLGIFMLWAAWNLYGQYVLLQDKKLDLHHVPMMIVRILLLCSLMIVLVFVN